MHKSKKPLTLIKLGGSVITDKEKPRTIRTQVLERLVKEIKEAGAKTSCAYIVGHGQGSFAHEPASRYKTMDGFVSDESKYGMCVTHDSAMQLNRIVVAAFLAAGVPALSYPMSATLVTSHKKMTSWSANVLEEYLAKGLLPISGGDVMVDTEKGCTIWSTEQVLGCMAEYFLKSEDYLVERVVHVTEVSGVLDCTGEVVAHLTAKNWPELQQAIGATKGFDVTGGMGHKIEESLELARQGVDVRIISGLQPGLLYETLLGKHVGGTKVE